METTRPTDSSRPNIALVRLGCGLLIAAAVAKAIYSGLFEQHMLVGTTNWPAKMTLGFAVFLVGYVMAGRTTPGSRRHNVMLVAQSAAAIGMICIYPSFIVTVLTVVIAWQIAWAVPLRAALAAVALQSVILALINCIPSRDPMNWLVLITTFGFEFFAVSAAHLARGEAAARAKLAKINDELRAAQTLLSESARAAERMRISRDLHDALGHSLTSLTIQLDVASRLTRGPAAKHLGHARDLAGNLLNEVRSTVNHIRVAPVDLRDTLGKLADSVIGLKVEIVFPDDLFAIDAPRADTILRCAQELITNTLRHAEARELVITLEQKSCGELVITGSDDGRGGTLAEGSGLAGMRERFELLGGRLSVASPPDRGFIVRGQIPPFAAFA